MLAALGGSVRGGGIDNALGPVTNGIETLYLALSPRVVWFLAAGRYLRLNSGYGSRARTCVSFTIATLTLWIVSVVDVKPELIREFGDSAQQVIGHFFVCELALHSGDWKLDTRSPGQSALHFAVSTPAGISRKFAQSQNRPQLHGRQRYHFCHCYARSLAT